MNWLAQHFWNMIGWLGSFFLIICAFPQVYQTFKTKNVTGLSFMMLVTWSLGCFFALTYGIHGHVPIPIVLSYIVNGAAAFLLVVAFIKYRKK